MGELRDLLSQRFFYVRHKIDTKTNSTDIAQRGYSKERRDNKTSILSMALMSFDYRTIPSIYIIQSCRAIEALDDTFTVIIGECFHSHSAALRLSPSS